MSADAHEELAPLELGSSRSRPGQSEALADREPLPLLKGAPAPPRKFAGFGPLSRRFPYQASGAFGGYVIRTETATGNEFGPLRYGGLGGRVGCHIKGGAGGNPPPPHPLPELRAAPIAPVLPCEGETSADAVASLHGPTWAVIASMNQVALPQCTAWSPIAACDLVTWRDNNVPGWAYAPTAAAPLRWRRRTAPSR